MSYERCRQVSAAHRAALMELAARHEDEFAQIYARALETEGVTGLGLEKPCPCGGTLRRNFPRARWPKRCVDCPPEIAATRGAA